MGRKIEIGYLKYLAPQGISQKSVEDNFINLLARYTNIRTIRFRKIARVENILKKIEKYKLDYLYISTFICDFHYLRVIFYIREKVKLNIPFIFYIHAIYPWVHDFVYSIPFLRNYDKILAPSEYAKNIFLKLTDKFNVHVIPHCIDINLIRKNSGTAVPRNKKIITFMGRLVENKGIGILIKLLPMVIAKKENVHLNIIGPLSGGGVKDLPKSPYVNKLEKWVREHRLTNRVTFNGVCLGLNKYRVLSESDLFVNPTLATAEETFGIVNIEALACGVPVITTSLAGGREIITNAKNGYLLGVHRNKKGEAHFDHKQLLSLILKVLCNSDLNSRLKKNALISSQKYNFHVIMPRLVRLLKERGNDLNFQDRWEVLKDKRPIDVSNFFNSEYLFFLFFEKQFRNYTFSAIYNEAINGVAEKSLSPEKDSINDFKMKNRNVRVIKKVKYDFYKYLTAA